MPPVSGPAGIRALASVRVGRTAPAPLGAQAGHRITVRTAEPATAASAMALQALQLLLDAVWKIALPTLLTAIVLLIM